MTTPPVARMLTALGGDVRPAGDGEWMARCPAHDDRNPSLGIGTGDDGRALVVCYAGCTTEAVLQAVGLRMTDIMPNRGRAPTPRHPKRERLHAEHWRELHQRCRADLTPERLDWLASDLMVHPDNLTALGIGWSADDQAYTFPEVDSDGAIIGIQRRWPDGRKQCMGGGRRGLYVPDGLDLRWPIFVVEGESCTAACLSIGLSVVGRPSAKGGVDLLAAFLADAPDVWITGELDGKPDGRCPGIEGAEHVSNELARRWGRPVPWALPPHDAGDMREWISEHDAHVAEDLAGMFE